MTLPQASDPAWAAIWEATWKSVILGWVLGVLTCLPGLILGLQYLRKKKMLDELLDKAMENLTESMSLIVGRKPTHEDLERAKRN